MAAAAFAAIIAADFSTAQAQSDETSGRIVARLLDDGRVEFGWQPSGGERVLPRQRYFPADATVDRWLRSSPVEVGGAELGRINARLLGDGRIEFAFTPTDGERIEPQARYFPAGARVGRWLRSTEIAIGPASSRYIAVSAGSIHTCAIRSSGEIACWGANGIPVYGEEERVRIDETGQTDAPAGSYIAVSAGGAHTCAIRAGDSGIACWGNNQFGESDAPSGSYSAVSAADIHNCAIKKSDSELQCWGVDWGDHLGYHKAKAGSFSAIATSRSDNCAIRESDGVIECWGNNWSGQSDAPEGSFIAVSVGNAHTCAIRASGELACWGSNTNHDRYDSDLDIYGVYVGQDEPPPGSFTAVSAGDWHNCAIRASGDLACWGDNEFGQTDAPTGSYIAVSAGSLHACAIRASDGAIRCWGANDYGQTDVPTD